MPPVGSGADRQHRATKLVEGRERDRKDNLGPTDGNSQVTLIALGLADGDRRGAHRGALLDRLIWNWCWIAARDADLSDRNQQEGNEVLNVAKGE